ncbi:serine/threonine protein kinase, partial [Pyxidicoccus sp. 3LFB2]
VVAAVPSSASVVAGSVTPDKPEATEDRRPTPAKPPGKKKPVTPAPAPTVRYVSPAAVLKVLGEEGGKHYVERGWASGLKPGMEIQVLGPAKNGQRAVLGLARVEAPAKGLKKRLGKAYLELDDAALASSGDLFVPVTGGGRAEVDGPETETETEEAQAAEPEKPVLNAAASRQTGIASITDPGIKVRNLGTTPWTECRVVKNGRYTAWLGSVPSNEERTVHNKRFKPNANYNVGSNEVGIFCTEGKYVTVLK